jgi:hypothetical protein
MKITFERDSVCIGDDANAPNAQDYTFDNLPLLSEVLNLEAVKQYLPSVSKSKTYWSAMCGGKNVAQIEHSYVNERQANIKFSTDDATMSADTIFFQYECQERIEG